jgi:signal transduction histidine kinase
MRPADAGPGTGQPPRPDPALAAAGPGEAGPGGPGPVPAGPGRRLGGWLAYWVAVATPLGRRSRNEITYWLLAFPLTAAGFAVAVVLALAGLALTASLAGALIGLAALALLTGTGRRLAGAHRRLAAWRLGAAVPEPGPFRKGQGVLGRLDARLRDGGGWRAVAYLLLRFPLALAGLYGTVLAAATGAIYAVSPLLWLLPSAAGVRGRRQHPLAGLSTPFPVSRNALATIGEAAAVCLLGLVLLAVARWAARLAVVADLWLMRHLLSPGRHTERIRELEASRAVAVQDAAATLRRVERDLHDGAQARLVALAMHLGRAREQLGADGEPRDVDKARELLAAAHQGAKDALTELRDLARGIHPPALDGGLEDALASLAASSAIPVRLSVTVTRRPSPAVETIAYFCAAELLANVAKHSRATRAAVLATGPGPAGEPGVLVLSVHDDGDGGARLRPGGGLAGLRQRVSTVDGTLRVDSPAGGPTRVTIELPA